MARWSRRERFVSGRRRTRVLVVQAVVVALEAEDPRGGAFARAEGLLPTSGYPRERESRSHPFGGRMWVESFNCERWKTRIELSTAIHDYIELFDNTGAVNRRSDAYTNRKRGSTQHDPTGCLTPEPESVRPGFHGLLPS